MKISDDLFNLEDVCDYFGLSESTIRRKVKESRENGGGFPLPLFKGGSNLRWRRADIENWRGEGAEVVMYNPLFIPPVPKAVEIKSQAQVRKGLEALGVKIPPAGKELDN